MTRVSPVTRDRASWFPADARRGRLGRDGPPISRQRRQGAGAGASRVAGGTGVLGVSVTTRGELLMDW
jgi:hypothetical protein